MRAFTDEAGFSLTGGPLYQLQRRIGLIPSAGGGVLRRIVCFVALTWLPVALGALAAGRAFGDAVVEPLSCHYGVHARLLVGIPLFVVAERVAERVVPCLLAQFGRAGLVSEAQEPGFREALGAAARLRDSRSGLALVLAAALFSALAKLAPAATHHEIAWAEGGGPLAAAAATWYLLVSRPFFAAFAVLWLWRVFLLFALFRRIARLDLRLVASHPDRSAGLGFLDLLPLVLAPVALGLATVLASRIAHEVVHHAGDLRTLHQIAAAWLALALALLLLPVLPFVRPLARLRRLAMLRYGALLGQEAQAFEARWLERKGPDSDEPLLRAPDVQAFADANTVYQVVERLRPIPLGLRDLLPFAAAAVLPFLPVLAIDTGLKSLLLRILSTLA